jgi:hypothetical protein
MHRRSQSLLSAFAALLVAPALRAQESPATGGPPPVQVHGFGTLLTGGTDGHRYRDLRRGVDAGTAVLALNVAAPVSDRLRITTQVHLEGHNAETDTHIDMVLAEWTVSDAVRLRLGQVPQAFGIYTEVFDVGTLRPFLTLPQSVYGAAGIVAEGVRGVSVGGERPLGRRGWALGYDVYGGAMQTPHSEAALDYLLGAAHADEEHSEDHHTRSVTQLVGGRLVVRTPVPGLSVGASAYTGLEGGESDTVRARTVGAQAEYLGARWSLRGEAVREAERGRSVAAGYVEAAYRFRGPWQAAVQFDAQRNALDGVDASRAPSLLTHRGVGLGLNYWFEPGLVVKAAYYGVDGNRFALPAAADLADAVGRGLGRRTRVLMAGAQLSF